MKTCCIVVIGHVDHGKTSLVHALTDIDTDRLPEEKARGLSIAPGFAHHTYGGGIIDFVDAPGHEDFIQAMISGATGASAALIVISAVEGVRAQTIEHLKIAALLGITRGVVAVTKSDLLSPTEQAKRLIEIGADLSQTQFAGAPLVLCSASTGDGTLALHQPLEQLLSEVVAPSVPLDGFLPIDRVFSLPGHGTIVTGTLLGGDLAVGETAILWPTDHTITIRSLQSRGTQRQSVHAGERVAVNLRGVAVLDVVRGMVLCAGGDEAPSTCVDARLETLPDAEHPLRHMDEVRVLFGTSSVVAQVRLFGAKQIEPAQIRHAQLRFKKPISGYAGQRAIIRRLSPSETIGGAQFLDPQAAQTTSGDKARLRVLEAVQTQNVPHIAKALSEAHSGVAKLADVARLSRLRLEDALFAITETFELIGDGWVTSERSIEACEAQILTALTAYHAKYPLKSLVPRSVIIPASQTPPISDHVIAKLIMIGHMRQKGSMFAETDHDPIAKMDQDQRRRMTVIEGIFYDAKREPPSLNSVLLTPLDQDLFDMLIDKGRLVSLQNVSLNQTLVFHSNTLSDAATALNIAFPAQQSFTTSQARAALATSRRIIVPMLEHFDSCAVTLRDDNMRQMAPVNAVSKPAVPC
jgi:selenocysteine-specific elongation factor